MSTKPSRTAAFEGATLGRWRAGLFAATGLALPLYAFPPFQFLGRDVDLATVLAALFVLSCAPLWWRGQIGRTAWILLGLALLAPALALLPPRPIRFSTVGLLASGAHWLLVFLFFLCAASAGWTERARRTIVLSNCTGAVAVAGFALYQTFGIPRHWPGTGPFLVSIQREPFRFTRVGGTFFSGGYTRPTSLFLEPAWLGGYLVWIAVLAFGLLLLVPEAWSRRSRIFLASTAVLVTLGILATVSWGAYADFAVALSLLLIFSARRADRRRRLAALVLVAVVVLGALFASPAGTPVRRAIAQRWTMLRSTPLEGEDPMQARDSTWVRIRNLRHTVDLFRSRPWTGIGLGQFRLYAGPEVKGIPGLSMRDPWCGWVALAAELGVSGPLLLAAAIAFAARPAFSSGANPAAAIGISLVCLAVFQQFHSGSYLDLWWWYPLSVGAILARSALSEGTVVARDADL
ncbi:MAG TPA: O-antigen ligase family protein [Thermoanaerobaculia bacterium]|nr:O-antigen ligase family protein [Thermoanaerobaculia bacterium]